MRAQLQRGRHWAQGRGEPGGVCQLAGVIDLDSDAATDGALGRLDARSLHVLQH